jgi:aryl-alcohol dehydrogenase-like predicted oxidoreductase
MDADHTACTVEARPGEEAHWCPPCPHGLERGGTFTLTGNQAVDAKQRQMKLREIDAYHCHDPYHKIALASFGLPRHQPHTPPERTAGALMTTLAVLVLAALGLAVLALVAVVGPWLVQVTR